MSNSRRGFVRLVIVLAIVYFFYWAAVAFFAWQGHLDWLIRYDPKAPWNDERNLALMVQENRSSLDMSRAVLFGLIPALVISTALAAHWVFRGFKPRGAR